MAKVNLKQVLPKKVKVGETTLHTRAALPKKIKPKKLDDSGVKGVIPRQQGLSDKDFRRLSSFIEGRCGIQMPPSKKTMRWWRVLPEG